MPDKPGQWVKVFCPEARCMSDEEVDSIPEEQRKAMSGKEGLWLEMFCPDDSCLNETETARELKAGSNPQGQKGFWLSTFCPQDGCLIKEDTDLP